MVTQIPSTAPAIGLNDGRLALAIDVAEGESATLVLRRAGAEDPGGWPRVPVVDIVVAGSGRSWSGSRYVESVVGRRLRYAGHHEQASGQWRQLELQLEDPITGLLVSVFYQMLTDRGVLRSWASLVNGGTTSLTVESVTSFLGGGIPGLLGHSSLADLDLMWAGNDWLAEGRWQRQAMRDLLPDLTRSGHSAGPRGRFGLTSTGSWSCATYLPMGAIINRRTGDACAWQIEHNGAWHWQVGEFTASNVVNGENGAYVALLGPTDVEHQWRITLFPGDRFTTVPASVAISGEGFEGAVAGLIASRRAARRPHDDHRRLPVIFNDYMNTLNGDPTTDRLLPLITAAAAAGAEYFCIDAGWYAEIGESWWDSVGAWQPSSTRFPQGITEVLDTIRACDMVPGLWLEPEVVGVRSPLARRLPDDAFFTRAGVRVVEHGRHHLDLRHPAAVAHLDSVIDFLVGELGIGYLKLDYNINAGSGTETGGLSPGAGLLGHNRAYLGWLETVLDRYPSLTIENCASGGLRADYGMLSRAQLQSTSDQQDHLRYPPIAIAASAALTPEQAAVWAYPQPFFTEDEIGFTMCSALLGRIHLSGHLDQLNPAQRQTVAEAVRIYKTIRGDLRLAVPFWPLGLPRWMDSRLALGIRAPGATYLAAWRRPADPLRPEGDSAIFTLPVPHLQGIAATPLVLYPGSSDAEVSWDPAGGQLAVSLPRAPSACLIRVETRKRRTACS